MDQNAYHGERSVLASLRAMIPIRPAESSEALVIAELQANRLLTFTGITDGPVPSGVVTELPRIRLVFRDLPASGLSYWDRYLRCWIICLNVSEPRTRQRFTLLHEYKHIIDHGHTDQLYIGSATVSAEQQAEHAADYFAGCALMPKRLIKRAWGQGIQQPAALAARFDVSVRAMDVRLMQLGLSSPRARCTPPSTGTAWKRGRTYRRQLSHNWPLPSRTISATELAHV